MQDLVTPLDTVKVCVCKSEKDNKQHNDEKDLSQPSDSKECMASDEQRTQNMCLFSFKI